MDRKCSNTKPYHLFEVLGKRFMFDTTGRRFYAIEEHLYEFLQLTLKYPIRQAAQILKKEKKFDDDIILNDANAIKLMSDNGLFDTPENSIELTSDDILRKYIEASPLIAIELMLAEECNFACKYCFCGKWRPLNNHGLMSIETAHKAVDFLFANSTKSNFIDILFFGGEPLLNKEVLLYVIDYSQKLAKQYDKKITYRITTNASLVDDNIADVFYRYNIEPMVSLDGPAHIHNKLCPLKSGQGSFNLVMKGIKKLLDHKCKIHIRCTLSSREFILSDLIDFFSQYKFHRVVFEPVLGHSGNNNKFQFTDSDYYNYMEQHEKILPEILKYILTNEGFPYNPYFNFLKTISSGIPNVTSKPFLSCGASRVSVNVGADGNIYPCCRFSGEKQYEIGHIDDSINYDRCAEFWSKYNRELKTKCEECWANSICKGQCPWEWHLTDGNFDANDEQCFRRKRSIEHAAFLYFNLLNNNEQERILTKDNDAHCN